MKKFYAKLIDRENAILIDGDRMEMDDSFLYVYLGSNMTGMFDRGSILYCHLTEKKNE